MKLVLNFQYTNGTSPSQAMLYRKLKHEKWPSVSKKLAYGFHFFIA